MVFALLGEGVPRSELPGEVVDIVFGFLWLLARWVALMVSRTVRHIVRSL